MSYLFLVTMWTALSPKQYLPTKLHSVTSQKTTILIMQQTVIKFMHYLLTNEQKQTVNMSSSFQTSSQVTKFKLALKRMRVYNTMIQNNCRLYVSCSTHKDLWRNFQELHNRWAHSSKSQENNFEWDSMEYRVSSIITAKNMQSTCARRNVFGDRG
jgi:hypothetical protein